MKQYLKRVMLYFWNFWPPFLGAGIYIKKMSSDLKEVEVTLKRRPWTSNFIGTQFGGSMFAMADPFYMVMLAVNLGHKYFVVDQSSEIKFTKKGKTKLVARFSITDQELDEIKTYLKTNEKFNWIRKVHILDEHGDIVAVVTKNILIKLRK